MQKEQITRIPKRRLTIPTLPYLAFLLFHRLSRFLSLSLTIEHVKLLLRHGDDLRVGWVEPSCVLHTVHSRTGCEILRHRGRISYDAKDAIDDVGGLIIHH